MSEENVQQIIGRAVTDDEFRALLLSEPEKALEEYELTDAEMAKLKALDSDQFGELAMQLGERLSRPGLIGLD